MNGKLKRISVLALAVGLGITLSGCATAPAQELSILETMSTHSMSHPQSCEAVNAATVCVQTMRMSRNKSCGCADRRAIADGNFGPGF
jgi:pectin methylesterase-like acyl-CoA thioesterase